MASIIEKPELQEKEEELSGRSSEIDSFDLDSDSEALSGAPSCDSSCHRDSEKEKACENDFANLVFQWFLSMTHLNISGLQETITEGLMEYIVANFPYVKSLDDTLALNRLPIFTHEQQSDVLDTVFKKYSNWLSVCQTGKL